MAAFAALAAIAGPADAAKAPSCAARPTVAVSLAPLDLADPPQATERFYPKAARQAGVSGHATLECNAANSALGECAIDDETPTGQGFGESALKLAKTLVVLTPATAQIVRLDVQYDIAPPTDPSCSGS
jgi:hypothetical protein